MRNRLLLSGIATSGALETGILTFSKYFAKDGAPSLCLDGTCSAVLSSPFSVIPVVNVPLVAAAFVGYSMIAALALTSVYKSVRKFESTPAASDDINNPLACTLGSGSLILFLSTAMATFSGYMMTVLALVLHTQCNLCYLSALLSVSMASVAWTGQIVPNKTRAFVVASSSVLVTLLASVGLYYATTIHMETLSTKLSDDANVLQIVERVKSTRKQTVPNSPIIAHIPHDAHTSTVNPTTSTTTTTVPSLSESESKSPPVITTTSSTQAVQLAMRLKHLNAKMYGTYWCSHCCNQKQTFGQQAYALLEYVECDRAGANSQCDLCTQKKVRRIFMFCSHETTFGKFYFSETML